MRQLAFVVTLLCICSDPAYGQPDRIKITWPSPEFRTFQAAVDAAPHGALIEIEMGDYSMDPVFVRGKTLEFAGAGSGRNPDTPVTRLLGPSATPVVDEDGNLIQPVDSVTGLFNLTAANVVIRDLVIERSNAAVVIRDDEKGRSGRTVVQDVVISGAARGIVSLGSGESIVKDSAIENTLWHGISAFAPVAGTLHIEDTVILTPFCAGIFFANTSGVFINVTVSNASCGGIVGIHGTGTSIQDAYLLQNHLAGILLFDTDGGFIDNNLIQETLTGSINHPALKICVGQPDCGGDAIQLLASGWVNSIYLRGNTIQNSYRASVAAWGSAAALEDNTMTCAAFDIDVEPYQSVDTALEDVGGNQCGCGGPLTTCIGVSANLVPSPPIYP